MISEKQRIAWIDCAKGIAILLVVFGHTVGVGNVSRLEAVFRGIIFSFHMPLFFILSCITFRFSNDSSEFLKKTEKAFRHLIIPVFMLYGIRVFYGFVVNGVPNDLLLYIGGGLTD